MTGTYETDLLLSLRPSPTSVIVRDTSTGRTVWSGATGRTYPPEFAATGAHRDNLRRLAELTGGRIVARGALRELTGELSSEGFAPVWIYLLTAALGVMLMEWALMRIRRRPIARGEHRTPEGEAAPLR